MQSRRRGQEALLGLIELVYSAAQDSCLWEAFLLSVVESLDVSSAHLLHHDLKASGLVAASVHLDPDIARSYNEHVHRVDLYAIDATSRPQPIGSLATGEMLLPRVGLKRTEYFTDFAIRFDVTRLLSVLLARTRSSNSVLTLLRRERDAPFDPEDLRFVRTLTPHIQRALQIHERLRDAEEERTAAVEALDALRCGVFLVDSELKVVVTNGKGREILAARDGLATDRGRLWATSPGVTKKLRDTCAAVSATRAAFPRSSGGAFALARPSGQPPLQVLVAPAAATTPLGLTDARVTALIFVSDPADDQRPSERLLRQFYRLTPAECDVAVRLVIGRSLEEIAAERGSAIETVRRQNKQILAKTGARHRSELVHRLSTMLPSQADASR